MMSHSKQSSRGQIRAEPVKVARAKKRFSLPDTTPVVSCYEVGRDGFWLHRSMWLIPPLLQSIVASVGPRE
jgi:hypothetical protein